MGALTLPTSGSVYIDTMILISGCGLFISNDASFRSVAGLPLVILDDLLKP